MLTKTEKDNAKQFIDVVPEFVNGKYKQELPKEVDGYVVETHEYVTATGEVGYQQIVKRQKGEDWFIMSKGHGAEAESRTFDWTLQEK